MKNKALIYDDTCPLCVWYSDQFVQTGMLANRIAFADLGHEITQQIDPIRSKHEIPLVDLEGQKTIYGLDSLVYILSERVPFLGRIMNVSWIYAFFKGVYKLVSYNRRVIVASNKTSPKPLPFDCTPDFDVFYRSLYIALALVLATALFTITGNLFVPNLGWALGIGLVAGMAIIGGLDYATHKNVQTSLAYLGQWSTILLIGGLLSLPTLIFLALLGEVGFVLFPIGLLLILGLMGKEYWRRMSYLKAGNL